MCQVGFGGGWLRVGRLGKNVVVRWSSRMGEYEYVNGVEWVSMRL